MSALIYLDPPHEDAGEESAERVRSALSSLHPPRCIHLARLPYIHTHSLAGIVVHPAHVVLGLAGWEDAFEGILPACKTPVVLFDLEKLLRMMLSQSGLAAEILAAPTLVAAPPGFDPRALLDALATTRLLDHYRQLPRARHIEDLRGLMTGALLARTGQLSLRPQTLLLALAEVMDTAPLHAALLDGEASALARAEDSLRALWGRGEGTNSLPARPLGYDAASAMLVAARMAR